MTSQITAENYVFKFGRYIGQKATQVATLTKVDKKGKDVNVGLQYLEFIVERDWLREFDSKIIKQVIENAKKNIVKEPEEVVEKNKSKNLKEKQHLVNICCDDDEQKTVKF